MPSPLKSTLKHTEMQFTNAELLPRVVSLLKEGHTVTLPLRGFSMRPFLEDRRDKALLTYANPDSLHKGMAVLAEIIPSHYVLHRIVDINADMIILRGDGNIGTEQCRRKDVKAIAVGFYRKGRTQLDRTDGLKWRVYSVLWVHLFPVRRYLLWVYRLGRKLKKF